MFGNAPHGAHAYHSSYLGGASLIAGVVLPGIVRDVLPVMLCQCSNSSTRTGSYKQIHECRRNHIGGASVHVQVAASWFACRLFIPWYRLARRAHPYGGYRVTHLC